MDTDSFDRDGAGTGLDFRSAVAGRPVPSLSFEAFLLSLRSIYDYNLLNSWDTLIVSV